MKLIVTVAHKSKYPNPICFKAGDSLITGKRDAEYDGWIWITTCDGNQGWAPEQSLKLEDGTSSAIATLDYTAQELDTVVGEQLILHHELNDWGWVENRNGMCGWVPMKTTRSL